MGNSTERRIKDILVSNEIVLFMKGVPASPQCGFSGAVVQILSGLGVPFTGVNVLAYSNTSTLMNAATILAGQGQSLSTVSMGRVSYHELLIVAAPGGATVITGDVPEPATLMLIGGGLILLALSLRKRGKINEL